MIRRLLPLFAFLVLASLLFVGVRMNSGKDVSAIPSPLIGRSAPAFALPAYEDPNKIIGGKDLLGAPYLLNVWGSWCPNCQVEHPVIATLAQGGKVRVVGYDYKDTPDDARRWLAEFGNPYSMIIVDADGRAALDWGIYGAPETFLVDAAGIVRWKHVGPIDATVVHDEIEPWLARLGARP